MGTSYTAVLAVGKEFESKRELREFLDEHGKLENYSEEELDDITECVPNSMQADCLDLYTGYGYYIGRRISSAGPVDFKRDFDLGMANWEKEFPGVPASIIHTVRIS